MNGIAIGLGLGALLGIAGFAIYKATSSTTTTTTTSDTLTPGHRYLMTIRGATKLPTVATLQQAVDQQAPGALRIVSIIPAQTGGSVNLEFDVLQTTSITAATLAEGTTYTLKDEGLSPPAQSGGSGGGGGVSGSYQWVKNPQKLNPGDQVRASVASSDFATIAQGLGLPASFQGFQQFLALPQVVAVLGPTQAWPGTVNLPADWPTDDTSPGTESHFAFTYAGPLGPLNLASFPVPAQVWTLQPMANVQPQPSPFHAVRQGPVTTP